MHLLPISPNLSLFNFLAYAAHVACLCPGLINCCSRETLDLPCRKLWFVPWRDPGLHSSPYLVWGCWRTLSLSAPCLMLWNCWLRVPPMLQSPLPTFLSSFTLFFWLLYAMNNILQQLFIETQCCTRSSRNWTNTETCIHTKTYDLLQSNTITSNLFHPKVTISSCQWLSLVDDPVLLLLRNCPAHRAVTTVVPSIPSLTRRDEKLMEPVLHLQYSALLWKMGDFSVSSCQADMFQQQ